MPYKIVKISDMPELRERAAEWFNQKWRVPVSAYLESMTQAIEKKNPVPQWYLVLDGERIISGMGVIENDFHPRKDLTPNVCAIYTEPDKRGQGICARVIDFVSVDMSERGVDTLYLVTKQEGLYERYDWEYMCSVRRDGEKKLSRVYVHKR